MPSGSSDRVPRGTLTRARIVDAAVELADEEGIAGLSMPKLARRLGVGVMSLYSHVASKDDLLDAVADQFRALRRLLVTHPGLGDLLASRGVAVPAVFDLLERNLAGLLAAGVDGGEAVALFYALLSYTLGFATWQLPRASVDDREYRRQWRNLVDDLPTDSYPSLHGLRDALTTVASDDQFEFGLRRLTAGVGVRRRRPGTGASVM